MIAASNFKRGSGRDAHVALIPQPSHDPNNSYISYSFNYQYLNHHCQHRLNWLQKDPFPVNLLSRAFAANLDGALVSMAITPGKRHYVFVAHTLAKAAAQTRSAHWHVCVKFGRVTVTMVTTPNQNALHSALLCI